MTRPSTERDWRQPARIGSLVIAGAAGFATRYYGLPRWVLLIIVVCVPAVWLASRFQSVRPGESEAERRRRMRNLAIGLALFGLVALFYIATMIRLSANVFNRPI